MFKYIQNGTGAQMMLLRCAASCGTTESERTPDILRYVVFDSETGKFVTAQCVRIFTFLICLHK
jgi:hypothetical protein